MVKLSVVWLISLGLFLLDPPVAPPSSIPPSYTGTAFGDSRHPKAPQKIPGRLECELYDVGGEGVAYHDSDGKNSGSGGLNPLDGTYLNGFRAAEAVDISYTKDLSGVQWTGTDQERRRIEQDFARAQQWASAHDRPVLLGEFGAYDKAPMDSRARYTAAVARAAEKLGWSWAYWQFDSDFVVYDVEKDAWVEPIRKALIP